MQTIRELTIAEQTRNIANAIRARASDLEARQKDYIEDAFARAKIGERLRELVVSQAIMAVKYSNVRYRG